MKKIKIEYRELKCMGASEKALDFYSNTDPLAIYKVDDGYQITGAFECTCECDADLIATLQDFAIAMDEESK